MARARVAETGLPLIYVNQVGGQDELVFDGGSFALQADGALCMSLPMFETALALLDLGERARRRLAVRRGADDGLAARGRRRSTGPWCWACATMCDKSGFPGVLLGLSGGVDSALSLVVARDALGPERVRAYHAALALHQRARASRTRRPAPRRVGRRPGRYRHRAGGRRPSTRCSPAPSPGRAADITEENIQARIRGVTLMALSNKLGLMLLTTGNKSEMAVGYATLYGDMCGGYNVLKDLYKVDVYAVCRWRNATRPLRRPADRRSPSAS